MWPRKLRGCAITLLIPLQLPAGRMSHIQGSCALLFVPPSPFPRGFSEHSLALFLPRALVPATCVRGRMKHLFGTRKDKISKERWPFGGEEVLQPPWVVTPTFLGAFYPVLGEFLLHHVQITVYPGRAPGSCVSRLSPALAKHSGELEWHWAGDAARACQLGIVTVWQQGAGLAFWAIKILPLIRMVACFLALLASLPNSFVIVSIVMSWPRAVVTLALPVSLGMISLCLSEWLMKSADVHNATKSCRESRKSFTSWS